MIDQISNLVKVGNLKQAVEMLEAYARQIDADSETIADIVVLSGGISELERLSKRRKISAREASDKRTELSYEITDIIASLPAGNVPATASASPDIKGGSEAAAPIISSEININISIENVVTTEIRGRLDDVKGGFEELKSRLRESADNEAKNAAEIIEDLSEDLEGLSKAATKEQLPPHLRKIQDFFKRLEDGNDYLSRAIMTAKNGAAIAQKLARNYNSIAQWVGLPQVPKILTGE